MPSGRRCLHTGDFGLQLTWRNGDARLGFILLWDLSRRVLGKNPMGYLKMDRLNPVGIRIGSAAQGGLAPLFIKIPTKIYPECILKESRNERG